MKRLTYTLALTVAAPFLFRGNEAGTFGLDAAQLRDTDGTPLLPGDQARGVLKEALLDLATAAPEVVTTAEIAELFGLGSPPTADGEQDRPARGRLSVSDLAAAPGQALARADDPVVRVEIDDTTGAARTGFVQFVENVAPTGAEITFEGRLVLYWLETDAARIEAVLAKAVRIVGAVGAFKSVGFGRVVGGTITPLRPQATAATVTPRERVGLALRFDRPYLVDAERVVDNAFVGSVVVPGAVIKGALATKLVLTAGEAALERLSEALSRLVIGHAFPEDSAGYPGGDAVPLSTVAADGSQGLQIGDDLRLDGDTGAPGPLLGGEPAAFPTDWKASWWSKAAAALGRAPFEAPAPLPRTRTRIDEATGTARDEALFTTVARSHRKPETRESRRFLFTVDAGEVDSRAAAELLAVLSGGLDFVGKTDASVTIEPWPEGDAAPTVRPVRGHSDLFAVVLRSAAVLVDPRTETTAAEAYATYWSAVAGATLVDFCASQSLAGGYLAMRRRPWPGTYHPFLLTQAGSVFLLRGALAEPLARLVRTGLPLPRFDGAEPLDWRTCPFVPGNGYGAIRADHLSGADFGRIARVERTVHA